MTEKDMVKIVPSERQIAHQQTEFYAFVHFTVNTFTGLEWGDGTESEEIFNPRKMDAGQWVESIRAAGMKGLILTCKHHDGFCLWPSKYTKHTIAQSPYKGGKGDIVREVSDACRKAGIKFGVYLSPWDRNQKLYGTGKPYDDYFVNQLTELLTGYGDVFSVWFDGACGEGANGKKQIYDWERYYQVIRELQPEACISVCGPDVRWCGNEAGDTRESEWSVVPERTKDTEKIAEDSQQEDDGKFRERKIRAQDKDLGSRKALEGEDRLIWYPAEVNTSIRPGWFYHEQEDEKVRTLEELWHIYTHSVGGNATFLLNIPPTQEGLFHENDAQRLREFGEYLRKAFEHNLLEGAVLAGENAQEGHGIENVREDTYDTYYKPADGQRQNTITIEFGKEVTISNIVMKENIKLSQRVERFRILADEGRVIGEGTTIGYKKIVHIPETKVKKITIQILESRVCPTFSFIGIY